MSGKGSAQRPTDLERFADNGIQRSGGRRNGRREGYWLLRQRRRSHVWASWGLELSRSCSRIITLDLLERSDARCTP